MVNPDLLHRRNLEHLANGVHASIEEGAVVLTTRADADEDADYTIYLTDAAFEALVRYVNKHIKREGEE